MSDLRNAPRRSTTRNTQRTAQRSASSRAAAPRAAAPRNGSSGRQPSRPQKKSTSGSIFIVLVLLLVLVAGGVGISSLLGANGAASTSSGESAASVSSEANEPTGPKKTAAGNQAVGHVRTIEERMATSDSANNVTPGPKTVYLTFDDGPSTNTHRILEILESYGVKATWFIKGNQPQIEYVKDIWGAGNQVGIHTQTHNYTAVYASTEAYWTDLHDAGAIIRTHLGFEPTLVRFPGGSHNSYNGAIIDSITSRMASENIHYFDWNVSSGDGGDHDAQFIVDYVLGQADGCHSCCLLMHDSAAKDTTVEALPTIIEWFIDNDFEFDVLLADSYGYHF